MRQYIHKLEKNRRAFFRRKIVDKCTEERTRVLERNQRRQKKGRNIDVSGADKRMVGHRT